MDPDGSLWIFMDPDISLWILMDPYGNWQYLVFTISLVEKLIIFTDGGYPPPRAENSAKIINLLFEPFP